MTFKNILKLNFFNEKELTKCRIRVSDSWQDENKFELSSKLQSIKKTYG